MAKIPHIRGVVSEGEGKMKELNTAVDISKLKREKVFENEKIKISFSIGQICDELSVYIKDECGKNHHILWKISPDRCQQSFDKANEKIRAFVQDKIDEWVAEDEEEEKLRNERIQNRKNMEEIELRNLIDSF